MKPSKPPPASKPPQAWPLAALPLLGVLAACSGTLLPGPAAAPARYTLDTAPAVTAVAPATRWPAAADRPGLTVERPRAAPGYDSRRMVYTRQPQALDAFAFHEWVEPPADLLAPLLVRALQDTGAFGTVLLAPSVATGRWRLETQLLRLAQDFSVQPSVLHLGLRAVLLDGTTRQALAWREFDIREPASADDPVAGAAAAQRAAGQAARALAVFCAEQTASAATATVVPTPHNPERPTPP